MKILYTIMAYGPQIIASEVHSELGRYYRQHGHTFSVLSLEDYAEAGEAGAKPFPDEADEVKVYTLKFKNSFLRRLLRKICQRLFHYGFFLELLLGYRRFLKKNRHKIDLVHVEAAYPLGAVAALASFSVNIPFLVNLQGADVMRLPEYDYGYGRYWLARLLLRLTFKRAAGVRANSEQTAQLALQYGAQPEKVRVILRNISEKIYPPAGFDLAENKWRQQKMLRERYNLGPGPILMSYSRLHPFKGVDWLVKAVPILKRELGNFNLLVCGPSRRTPNFGDYREYLEKLAEREGVKQDITFTGKVDFACSQDYLAGADLLVVPSIIDALNKVVIEAAAVGTPSVSTETTGIASHATQAGIGVTVAARSEKALAQGIQKALQQKDAMSAKGSTFAAEFTAEVIGQQLLEFYEDIVERKAVRLCYVAYPSSLVLKSANAIQTYTTCRELKRLNPQTLVMIPRLPGRPSRFADPAIRARHLLRLPLNFFNNFGPLKIIPWTYLERAWFSVLAGLWLLIRRVTGRGVKVIYVRDVIVAYFLLRYWQKILGAKIIYEAHDLEQRNPSRARSKRLKGWLEKVDGVLLDKADGVVSLTGAFVDFATNEGYRPKSKAWSVIPDAYDSTLYKPTSQTECRRELGLPEDEFIIVYSGLTFAYRNLDKLVDAFAAFLKTEPDAKTSLLFVGGRPFEQQELLRQAASLGLEGKVKCAGQFPPEKVSRYLNAASLLAIPDTVTDITASPLKLFEYAAVGRPVMLPDISSLKEILTEDEAYYFTRGEVPGMTEAIWLAWADREEATKRAEAARQHVANYTYANRARSILDFAESFISAGKQTGHGYTQEYFAAQVSKSEEKAAWQYGKLLKYAGVSPTTHPRLLDAGCGAGPALGFLGREGYKVTGSDFIYYPLEEARKRAPNALLVNADLKDGLPFADGTFDIILASEVIEHLVDAWAFLRECNRVLAHGGCLILTTPNLWDLRRPWAAVTGQTWSGYQDPTHINLMNPARLAGLLKQTGYAEIKWQTGIKPWWSRRVRKLGLSLDLPYPPVIGNGIMAVAFKRK